MFFPALMETRTAAVYSAKWRVGQH